MSCRNIRVRSAFNFDPAENSLASGVACDPEEGKTQQQFAEEVDINTIVRRFGLTGKVPVGLRMPESGDFSAATDFHEAMNVIKEAERQFMTVPPEIRRRFYEDPQKFADWLHDPASREEATKLGFFKVPDVPRPVVDPAQASAPLKL